MGVALLDLSDSNLQLWHGSAHVQSPGYALLRGGDYLFGAAARAAARLQPRDINTRFWWQLGTEQLQPALGPARHTADLAHAHLAQLYREAGEPAEVVLAVSGSLQREQLSLLLGIVQQCPFDAVGLVNRSVALASLYEGGTLFHLEIQLHQALLVELAARGEEVALVRSVALPGCGLLPLQERLVEAVAGAFVRQVRFDPRRKADTEQRLYDALPAALRNLRDSGETNIEVNGYRARIARDDLLAAGERLCRALRDSLGGNGAARLLVDPAAALLPGLQEALPALEVLAGDEVREALQAHSERLLQRSEALDFVTALPALARRGNAGSAAVGNTAQPPQPTHLLQGGIARRLRAAGTVVAPGCEVFRAGDGWQLRGGAAAQHNGSPYRPGQSLLAGDAIAVGATQPAQLIAVEG